ncbi:flagellar filament capping protein FliD [Campylobacter sp. LR185c]|uniref:flagellar filament capping protein FliD n=1 Tax=Campylobacter sp. LR185c TaxID=2014525 RepID=UPI001237EF6A|nr:flagellar filament capping protein FliD [Campylobacter sp. LR185c]KAA6225375.1 flagellar filament capping protein FliD [Campylobacter sp. LR185c]KAA8604934.1 flagellar capping protein [Campylobacter sp. LR185c]
MATESSSLSSLGFASGVLTQDVIDQLKAADETSRLTPYTTQIESNTTKQTDVTELITMLSSLKTSVSTLGDGTIFTKRSVTANKTDDPAATLTADSGVALQSLNVSVTQLAQKDVYQSAGFSNNTGYVNSSLTSPTAFTLFVDGQSYTINVTSSMTYQDLADEINSATDGAIVAKIVNTGEKDAPYRLTLTSGDSGSDNAITFFAGTKNSTTSTYETSTEAEEILKNLGWEMDTSTSSVDVTDSSFAGYGITNDADLHVQTAQDAYFTIDGIKYTRSSNTIDDLTTGLTLTLNTIGDINFEVTQDLSAATEAMESLVEAYNNLIANLSAATDYDIDTGTSGSLVGVNAVTSIKSTINKILFGYQTVTGTVENDDGTYSTSQVLVSLLDYGLSVSDDGVLSFDSSTFESKMKEDPDFAEEFFAGIREYETLTYTSNLIKTGSLEKALQDEGGSITFSSGDFKIIYNETTYDLYKNKDGSTFVLTGNTEEEIMQNLVTHINDLGIEGLTASYETYNKNGETGYNLVLTGTTGSNLQIKGDSDFLSTFGLKETTMYASIKEATGIFAELKDAINGIIGTNGSLTLYDESLTSSTTALTESKERVQEMIDAKYATMENQWLQYEKILSALDSQLSAVEMLIEMMSQSDD